jgi:nucleoside-diphosphate-sugar epimerase
MLRIIGGGLIARELGNHVNCGLNCVVFASGVANSAMRCEGEFKKERRLLEVALNSTEVDTPFIYFGTCSVYDLASRRTPYVSHKLEMEERVLTKSSGYVFRLPQVVGNNANPDTLVRFLVDRIMKGERFECWEFASRNIIDVSDVSSILITWLKKEPPLIKVQNIANPKFVSILELIRVIESIVGREANFDLVPRGGSYNIDVLPMIRIIGKSELTFDDSYLYRVLNKYYGNRSS